MTDQISNDSLCCSHKYSWCVCRCIGKLYSPFLTFLINLSKICIFLHKIYWIKHVYSDKIMALLGDVLSNIPWFTLKPCHMKYIIETQKGSRMLYNISSGLHLQQAYPDKNLSWSRHNQCVILPHISRLGRIHT